MPPANNTHLLHPSDKHPSSLYLLFFTEMWERFSFYGMRALFVLYLIDEISTGGQGWSDAKASNLYGTYLAAIYFSCIFGGYIADRLIGFRKAIIIGGLIIIAGHISLAFSSINFFYLGIGLLVAGTGLLKPSMSSIVGQLYPASSSLKDSAYTIFYMGINVGGLLGPIICGFLAKYYGWHYGFGVAALGMLLGLTAFYFKQNMLGNIGLKSTHLNSKNDNLTENKKLTKIEMDRLILIFVLSFFSIVFWMSFEQAGSSLNIFAQNYTDRNVLGVEIPAAAIQSVNAFWILILSIPLSWLWVRLAQANRNPTSMQKFALGLFFLGLAFALMMVGSNDIQQGATSANKSLWLLIAFYGIETIGEMCISPVGLAAVNKLSPPQLTGLMFGVWFSATAVGDFIAGHLASHLDAIERGHSMSYFFGIFVVATMCMSIIAFIFNKKLTAMMHGAA